MPNFNNNSYQSLNSTSYTGQQHLPAFAEDKPPEVSYNDSSNFNVWPSDDFFSFCYVLNFIKFKSRPKLSSFFFFFLSQHFSKYIYLYIIYFLLYLAKKYGYLFILQFNWYHIKYLNRIFSLFFLASISYNIISIIYNICCPRFNLIIYWK
jgi:hypothetical protein